MQIPPQQPPREMRGVPAPGFGPRRPFWEFFTVLPPGTRDDVRLKERMAVKTSLVTRSVRSDWGEPEMLPWQHKQKLGCLVLAKTH